VTDASPSTNSQTPDADAAEFAGSAAQQSTAAAAVPHSPTAPADLPTTLGGLRASGHVHRTVKEELRANLVAALRDGTQRFPGIVGYDDTVLPEVERAILAGHDMVLLGERGQGKTRLIRSLVGLLDEWTPVIAGSELNEHPYDPIVPASQRLVAERGDDTPVAWRHRDLRYGEKLATPDTSVGDLIGDVDPVRVAQGRTLGDPDTIHFGLVPRTNRGIFAVSELPDLAERIQVALLNVLEERDIQVRGYQVRLPLDLLLVASANPEDYTNRGRLITPLKDRFGSQIRTHYPLDVETELAIMDQESRVWSESVSTGEADTRASATERRVGVAVPAYLGEVIATVSQLARASSHVNQRSGVSVRLSVTNREAVGANALRRALRAGESFAVARVDDLDAMVASASGKIEIEALDDGSHGAIFDNLVRAAVLTVFKERVPADQTRAVITAFEEGAVADVGEDVSSPHLAELARTIPALQRPVGALTGGDESPPAVAAAVAFVLEGLHLSKRLNKDTSARRSVYRAR